MTISHGRVLYSPRPATHRIPPVGHYDLTASPHRIIGPYISHTGRSEPKLKPSLNLMYDPGDPAGEGTPKKLLMAISKVPRGGEVKVWHGSVTHSPKHTVSPPVSTYDVTKFPKLNNKGTNFSLGSPRKDMSPGSPPRLTYDVVDYDSMSWRATKGPMGKFRKLTRDDAVVTLERGRLTVSTHSRPQ